MHLQTVLAATIAATLVGVPAGMGFSAPAHAQEEVVTRGTVKVIDRRIRQLESQMQAVQRKVFPDGGKNYFEPEIGGTTTDATSADEGNPLSAILRRIDGLEQQQRELTGKVEELQFQMKQQQEALTRFQKDSEYRLDILEGKSPAPGPMADTAKAPVTPPAPAVKAPATAVAPAPAATPAAASADHYEAGRALYSEKKYREAATTLQAFLKEHPKDRRVPDAQFYAGRALYASDQTPEAAKAFLSNYQQYPKSTVAPNSLLWLSRSLLKMNVPDEACRVLNELSAAYPDKVTGAFAEDVQNTRTRAKCAR